MKGGASIVTDLTGDLTGAAGSLSDLTLTFPAEVAPGDSLCSCLLPYYEQVAFLGSL